MKIEFEREDIEAIAQRTAELLKPVLSGNGKKEDDLIFDKKGLAEYLKVTPKWIYERTHLKEMPHIKIGGQLRFRKRDIDKWLASFNVLAMNTNKRILRAIK